MATTWNPADNTQFILSNGNKTATNTSSYNGPYCRATGAARSSGKHYFEMTCTNGPGMMGVAGPSGACGYQNYSNVLYLFGTNGCEYGGSYYSDWYSSYGAGTYGFAVDLDAKTMKVRKGTGAWSSALSIAHMASVLPAISSDSAYDSITLNCGGDAFVGAIPDGYSAWDAVVTDDQSVI